MWVLADLILDVLYLQDSLRLLCLCFQNTLLSSEATRPPSLMSASLSPSVLRLTAVACDAQVLQNRCRVGDC